MTHTSHSPSQAPTQADQLVRSVLAVGAASTVAVVGLALGAALSVAVLPFAFWLGALQLDGL